MGTRNKEICVLLLDVGPFMHPALAFAAQAASAFVLSKILNKPNHELAMIYFGTNGVDNRLNEEMAAEGDSEQYTCITVKHDLCPPNSSFLETLSEVSKDVGRSDLVDALTVAIDCVYRAGNDRPLLQGAGVKKRIIMISNFLHRAAGDENDPFLTAVMDRLTERDIILEVISIDAPEQDAQQREDKDFNLVILKAIMQKVRHKHRSVSRPIDLLGALSAREYAHTAYYSGPLAIGKMMNIKVKVCKKTSREKLPTLGKYSDRSKAENASHQVLRETEHKAVNNPENPVPPEEKVKAYKYGKQVVPISEAEEQSLQYLPEKGFELLGFVDVANVPPRHFFMKDTWVVAPEKDNPRAQLAVSALAQAMAKSGRRAIVRFIPRAKGAVQIAMLSPALGPEDDDTSCQPDCMWMNILPFSEDVRTATFVSFEDQQKSLPSQKQVAAMRKVVNSMDLGSGRAEKRSPDTTVNPLLLRFSTFISSLVVNPANQVPEHDALMDATIQPDSLSKQASTALEELHEIFPLKAGAAALKNQKGKEMATQGQGAGQGDDTKDRQDAEPDDAEDVKKEEANEEANLGPVVTQNAELPPAQDDAEGDFDDMD